MQAHAGTEQDADVHQGMDQHQHQDIEAGMDIMMMAGPLQAGTELHSWSITDTHQDLDQHIHEDQHQAAHSERERDHDGTVHVVVIDHLAATEYMNVVQLDITRATATMPVRLNCVFEWALC